MPGKRKYSYDYARPMVTVDAVLLRLCEGELQALLIKRAQAPHKGKWALPGGFINMNETLEQSIQREVAEETGVTEIRFLTRLDVYGDPGRDPRGRVITVAFMGILPADTEARAGDDAAEAIWMPVESVPEKMAFDHDKMISDALELVMTRAHSGSGVFDFLPRSFTLDQLRQTLDAIFMEKWDAKKYLQYFLDSKLVRRLRGGKKYRFNVTLSE